MQEHACITKSNGFNHFSCTKNAWILYFYNFKYIYYIECGNGNYSYSTINVTAFNNGKKMFTNNVFL